MYLPYIGIERETTMSKDQQPSSQQKKQQNEAGPGLRRMKEPIKPDLSRRRERIKSAPGKTRTSSAKNKQRINSDSEYDAGKGVFSRTSSGELPPLTAESSAAFQSRSKSGFTPHYHEPPPQPKFLGAEKYLPSLYGSSRFHLIPKEEDDTARSSRSPVLLVKLKEKEKEVSMLRERVKKEVEEKNVLMHLFKFEKMKVDLEEKHLNDDQMNIADLEKERRDHKERINELETVVANLKKEMKEEKEKNESEKQDLKCRLHDSEKKQNEKDSIIEILQHEKELRGARIQDLEAMLQAWQTNDPDEDI